VRSAMSVLRVAVRATRSQIPINARHVSQNVIRLPRAPHVPAYNGFLRPGSAGWRSFATAAVNMRFTKDHEYVKASGNTATIGITNFAQQELGDVVFVELPAVGAKFKKGEAFGSVESVKAASSVYAPIDCEVTEANSKVSDQPALINSAAETDAWMIKAKILNPSQLNEMMDQAAYTRHCEQSKH